MAIIEQLIQKGVHIPNPEAVYIDELIDANRIDKNVTLYPGCKLMGSKTYVAAGARLGFEAPATVADCFVGPGVSLKGGYFGGSVFLAGVSCGSGAHVRAGTIMEEQASIAHTVGLKQTILLPFVTLGSLINFCDCLMAGGTDRSNHSEVGSSYIHFNYTPSQDKATPSLLGDVPRGVMLNQSPIFLGGQGGLVGPCFLNFGTVVAAGTICRHDQVRENHLVFGGSSPRKGSLPYKTGGYPNLKRIVSHNINFIANLLALGQWYTQIRSLFVGPQMPAPLFEGLRDVLDQCVNERLRQLERMVLKMEKAAPAKGLQAELCRHWPEMKADMEKLKGFEGDDGLRDGFRQSIKSHIHEGSPTYLETIQRLATPVADSGCRWLEGIVTKVNQDVLNRLPIMHNNPSA